MTNYNLLTQKIIKWKFLYKKFKTCKLFNPNDPIKLHTPRLPETERETIQPNFRCKSTTRILQQAQNCRKQKSETEKLGRNGLKRIHKGTQKKRIQ